MLDRIRVWYKDDADYKGIDPTELKALTDYFQNALVKALGPTYPVVTQPGPDVLRMRVAITDLIPTKPEMSVVTLVVPYATVADVAAGGGTGSTPYLGQTAIEAEFLDSRSNEVLAAYVDRQVGKKYNIDVSEGVGSAVEQRLFVLLQSLQHLGVCRSRLRLLGRLVAEAAGRGARPVKLTRIRVKTQHRTARACRNS